MLNLLKTVINKLSVSIQKNVLDLTLIQRSWSKKTAPQINTGLGSDPVIHDSLHLAPRLLLITKRLRDQLRYPATSLTSQYVYDGTSGVT